MLLKLRQHGRGLSPCCLSPLPRHFLIFRSDLGRRAAPFRRSNYHPSRRRISEFCATVRHARRLDRIASKSRSVPAIGGYGSERRTQGTLAQARRRLGTARDKGREAAPKINGSLGRLSWPPHRRFAWQSRLLSGSALEHVDQTKSKCIDRLLNAQRIL